MRSRYSGLAYYNKIDNYGNIRRCIVTRFIDRTPPEESKIHIVQDGENLMDLAYDYYNDISLWYLIAEANSDISDPFQLKNGQEIIVPVI